jgi:hypothetical protein
MSCQGGLDAGALSGGKSWGGLAVPLDHAVFSPLSAVSPERELGA